MYRIPLNGQERNKDRNIIKQVTINNGYKIKAINKLENKLKHYLTKQTSYTPSCKNPSTNDNTCLLYTSHFVFKTCPSYVMINKKLTVCNQIIQQDYTRTVIEPKFVHTL